MKRDIFINNEGVPEVRPTKEETLISEIGVIYLMRDPKNEEHLVYKAHSINKQFVWIGMWNSICHTGKPCKSLPELIKNAVNDGYIVKQMSIDDLNVRM